MKLPHITGKHYAKLYGTAITIFNLLKEDHNPRLDKMRRERPPDQQLRILQVNTSDRSGGAQRSAWNLFQIYRARGHKSWLAVGYKRTDDPDVLVIQNGNRLPLLRHYR